MPACEGGAIGAKCVCGGSEHTDGNCCGNAWQQNSCATGTDGWTDLKTFLVPSDGTRSLGDNTMGADGTNAKRDKGTKIVYFDAIHGNNDDAEVYWWDGSKLVDSQGNAGYGDDPLHPNEAAIKPFKEAVGTLGNAPGDSRLRTNREGYGAVAGGFADWFLFRRGQTFTTFDGNFAGGRDADHPAVMATYGPLPDGRATIHPPARIDAGTVNYKGNSRPTVNPFDLGSNGRPVYLHLAIVGFDIRASFNAYGTDNGESLPSGPATLLLEDCAWRDPSSPPGAVDEARSRGIIYLPRKTLWRRSVMAFIDGFYGHGFDLQYTFEEDVFFRNGFDTYPMSEVDPLHSILNRSLYQGGGAKMGTTYRNIISADGASGGPQMRFGGLIENSLILEGYWFSSTWSNLPVQNTWLTDSNQTDTSAIVKNNVQLVYSYPSANDPDSAHRGDCTSQQGNGYTAQGATFGAKIEGNIISNAMLERDLGSTHGCGPNFGVALLPERIPYENGKYYTQHNNKVLNNIVYGTEIGLSLSTGPVSGMPDPQPNDGWLDVTGAEVYGNVFAAARAIDANTKNLSSSDQLSVYNNHFYTDDTQLPTAAWMVGTGSTVNTLARQNTAKSAEGWPDPDRTLKQYVTEKLGLTLLDWGDDPWLQGKRDGTTAYDPTGMKTFMAVAVNMRRGGTMPIPTSGKPSWKGDYPWDERFTAKAVVNWIREGFGKPAVP